MQTEEGKGRMFQPIEDEVLKEAINGLGRSINIVSTYGTEHPVFKQSISATMTSVQTLLVDRKKIHIGAFNGVMTIDEVTVHAVGTLQKSLERHLVRLHITDLRLTQGITQPELTKLVELLARNEAEDFDAGLKQSDLSHVVSEATRLQAVQKGQTVANESDLAGAAGNGILVLEDELCGGGSSGSEEASVHVDQIVAFLQGDLPADDERVAEELSDLASDPDRLGKLIMESVAIRQSASPLSGESLSDVILGCLRRTFDGLRKQPAFKTDEGAADLQKALLLLEESMLDKIRSIAGESDTELDRKIVQAIREMDESLGFEMAARHYMEYREALETNRDLLKDYVRSNGADAAKELLAQADFPETEWKQIVVESREKTGKGSTPPIAAELSSLTMILEKLEHLMKADEMDGDQMEDLLVQANSNLSSTTHSAKEKLDTLSQQLTITEEDDTGTIDGSAREMTRKELLSSIAEIAQELIQPLTAINAAHQMLLNGYVGDITPEQCNLLTLASGSGDDLNYLMKELIKIVGLPVNRGVDGRFAVPSKAA